MPECFEEVGTVKDIVDGMLLISLSSTYRCNACSICTSGLEKEMRLTVFNEGNYAIGDRVKIKIEGRNLVAAAFIVYGVPLMDFFAGYLVSFLVTTHVLKKPEYAGYAGAIGGSIFFAASFFISRLINKKMEREGKYIIQVEKLLE